MMFKERNKKDFDDVTSMIKDDYPGLDFLGIQDVLQSKTNWYKFLWVVVILVNLGLGAMCTTVIVSEYLAKPTATLISYRSVKDLELPQVTVCGTAPEHLNFDDFYIYTRNKLSESVSNETLADLIVYFLAGSGYQKFEPVLDKWNDSYLSQLSQWYDQLRGEMSVQEYFILGMNTFGLQCNDIFQQCKLGETAMNCCEVFEPAYTIRRGKCWKSKPLKQLSYDENGKFGLRFKEPKKLFPSWSNQELILSIGDYKPEIGPFPRYYMYANYYNKYRLSATQMSLLEKEGVCSLTSEYIGKSTCYIQNWLEENLERPYNCTFPYMHTLRNVTVESCHPETIIRNYASVTQADGYDSHNCTLGCDRWEYNVLPEMTPSNFSKAGYLYRADINYNDLQYQEIKEVTTISFLGLVSQMGGQLGLFLGSSIIDLIQLSLIIAIVVGRYARARIAPYENRVVVVQPAKR